MSFAATNLVKPGLSSKRQQSEPPLDRNVFPPTPPPEAERSSGPVPLSRGASVRNGFKPVPAKLNIDKARPTERYEVRDERSPPQSSQRMGTSRSNSEAPRGLSRAASTRDEPRSTPQRREQPRRRPSDERDDEYPGELYDMYQNSRGSKNSKSRNQPRYIEEEEEYASDYDDGSFDENEFEMVSNRPPPRSRAASSTRAQSRKPDIRKIRAKVHAAEDVRYIMVGVAVEFPDLVDRVREKFGLRKRFRIKVRDEDVPNGDMITLGDQDDLDMVMMSVKANARKDRAEMGKMEVSDTSLVQAIYA